MPTYEYKCTNDGSTFEMWQEVGASAPPCPDCGAPTKKVFHPARVIFKGSGFYVTDTRAEADAKAGGTKKPAATENSTNAASSDSASNDSASSDNASSGAAASETKSQDKAAAPSQGAAKSGE